MSQGNSGRDVIVIGASAGGLTPLKTILKSLPADLPASIFIVMHIAPSSPGFLPEILQKAGQLPAEWAIDNSIPSYGRVYVAPPDRHLLLKPGRICVLSGPRENRFRPAADPLLRSAARNYGPRVISVTELEK
ncbi:MAG: CheB methylesterase [Planctomycetaceae bacterium]|nr:CheB methylesterase [Planctomycetaceae bacterium]